MLRFGCNTGLPNGTQTAWGCRAVGNQDGMVDHVPDRQDAIGPDGPRRTLLGYLNEHVDGAWRERASELLRTGVMNTRAAGEFTLSEDSHVVVKCNTNGSADYLCLCLSEGVTVSAALAEALRALPRAAFEIHIESIVAAALERIEVTTSVDGSTERQQREDAMARLRADGYTGSLEKMARGWGLLIDVAAAQQHDRGVHRHDHRTFATKLNIMFGVILTPVLFAGATQDPWPSLAHLCWETPVAGDQAISHHRYHMLTCVGCVERWVVAGPRGWFAGIGADGYDDSARQAFKHEISDVMTLPPLADDDLTCRPEHDTRHPQQSPTRPDHRLPHRKSEDR